MRNSQETTVLHWKTNKEMFVASQPFTHPGVDHRVPRPPPPSGGRGHCVQRHVQRPRQVRQENSMKGL